jgi:ribosomal protein S12 methylthiotransferase accessory factor
MQWVWGYSLGRQEPVLVPRGHAYFGPAADDAGQPPPGQATSNGCALGGCTAEAVVHGLLEVLERDAFLLMWYARMPVPRVAVGSARSARIRLLADRITREHGHRILAFDTSAEHGVPSVALLAVDPAPRPERPAVVCSAAAHLDPEQACWSALTELALGVADLTRRYPAQRAHAAAMAADSDLVREMPDHSLLYGHPATLPRWDFLPGCRPDAGEQDFSDAFARRPEPGADLGTDLGELTARLGRAGLDAVVVDQTGPEQRAAGLSSVKVLVPGALPMTFGHRNRLVHGLPRLHTVPVLLGHRTTPMPHQEVNPHPHPFS